MADWITEQQLCEWLKVNRITAWRWRKEGVPHIGTRKLIRYNKEQVEKWLEKKAKK
jgi:predicted site-specific integrase-resolvase